MNKIYKTLTALVAGATLTGCAGQEIRTVPGKPILTEQELLDSVVLGNAKMEREQDFLDPEFADAQYDKMLRRMREHDLEVAEKARKQRVLEDIPDEDIDLSDIARRTSSYNPIVSPSHAIIVGGQADGSDVIGGPPYVPHNVSPAIHLPPAKTPEHGLPWQVYAIAVAGMFGAYLLGKRAGRRQEKRHSREIVNGLVNNFYGKDHPRRDTFLRDALNKPGHN